MKRIFFILFLIMSTNAHAEKIDVVKHSRPGGLIDRMNEVIAQSLGDDFGEFINVGNCAQAKRVKETSKSKVLTALPTEREANDSPCNLDNSYLLSTFSNSPYHITYSKDNVPAGELDNFIKGTDIIVGVWDSNFWAPPQTEYLQSINPNIKVVRYKSKPFRTALASGEIDYKIVSFPGNDPVLAIMDGNGLNPGHRFSDMGYSMMFVGNFTYDVQEVYKTQAWQERKDKTHQQWMPGLARDEQVATVEKMLLQISEVSNHTGG